MSTYDDGGAALRIRRLDSGYWHVRGGGPCNWSQPPVWPCSEDELRRHCHPEAGEQFIRAAVAAAMLAEGARRREEASRG